MEYGYFREFRDFRLAFWTFALYTGFQKTFAPWVSSGSHFLHVQEKEYPSRKLTGVFNAPSSKGRLTTNRFIRNCIMLSRSGSADRRLSLRDRFLRTREF